PFSYDDFRAEMLVATGASGGLDEAGLMRAHGLTYVHNDPRAGIEALFRALVGGPENNSALLLRRAPSRACRRVVGRLAGWPLAQPRLLPSFETRARARSSDEGLYFFTLLCRAMTYSLRL